MSEIDQDTTGHVYITVQRERITILKTRDWARMLDAFVYTTHTLGILSL
jgi:hypothetical protein